MQEIQIDSAISWIPQNEPIGTLNYEQIRGNISYRWIYALPWLQAHRDIRLGADILNVQGYQYRSNTIFSFLQDAMPDRWGRRLIDKRERLLARQEGRAVRTLLDIDYLCQLDDKTRMGALRFRTGQNYIGQYEEMPVPPLAKLNEFTQMAQAYEQQETNGGNIREEWIYNLYRQGSSLGGARPKANVRDTDGTLLIAKIPSIHDDYDVALWEHFALKLAQRAGIEVAQTRLLQLPGQRYHTLLSRRFDRNGEERIHFASAMTLTGLQDGADAGSGNGYLDIADAIIGDNGFADIHATLCQLYRRIAYSIMIGNHDDHFRNHGFLLSPKGWIWSPAYDINPSDYREQSLLISPNSNESSIGELRGAAKYYQLTATEADSIIAEVSSAVRQWKKIAAQCGISAAEQQRFAHRIEQTNNI